MQQDYKLSIIIPVYNGAKNIGPCLDTIVQQQGFENFQVVVINDGSTDKTQSVVIKYVMEHPNIVLLKQRNSGVSVARNVGIRNAVGDYVTFVDADDQVGLCYSAYLPYFIDSGRSVDNMLISKSNMPKAIKKHSYSNKFFTNMLNAADNTNADVVMGGKITINAEAQYIKRHVYEQEKVFSTDPQDKATLLSQADLRESANFCLYSRQFLKDCNLRFMNNMQLDEDILFCMLACLYAQKVATVPDVTYLYNRHENSLSNTLNLELSNQKYTLANVQRYSKLLTEIGKYPEYAQIFNHWLHVFSNECNKTPDSVYNEYFPPTRCAMCPYTICDNECFLCGDNNYVFKKLYENTKQLFR